MIKFREYQVGIGICPANHAWRKGAVEKSAHTIAQRWCTLPDDATVAAAQAGLDRICIKFDARKQVRDGVRTTVGELANAEPLRATPAPFPAVVEVERTVTNQAQIAFRGNRYSLLPGHAGELVTVRHKLGTTTLDVTPLGRVAAQLPADRRRRARRSCSAIFSDAHPSVVQVGDLNPLVLR